MGNAPRDYSDVARFLTSLGIIYSELIDLDVLRKTNQIKQTDVPPDFCFVTEGRSISIELTNLIPPERSSIKQSEEIARKVLSLCEAIHKEWSLPNAVINLSFNFERIRRFNKKEYELAELIVKDVAKEIEDQHKHPNSALRYPPIPFRTPYTLRVYPHLTGETAYSQMQAFFGDNLLCSDVLQQIEKKHAKATKYECHYLDEYDENWLMLTVGTDQANTYQEYQKPEDFVIPKAVAFDHIYLYDAFGQKAYQWK